MTRNTTQGRLDRLQRECQVSIVPAIALCVACTVLVLMLSVGALQIETKGSQTVAPAQVPAPQTSPAPPTPPPPQVIQRVGAVAHRAMAA
jgi:hypothetical protein